jgi:hypothetical protein
VFRLFRKRTFWVPTWRGCLLGVILFGLAVWFVVANIHPFLSVTEKAEGAKVLVVEGWVPDYILAKTLSGFNVGDSYDYICTTGAELPRGYYLSEFKTYAELTAQTLEQLGVPRNRIIVAASRSVTSDRTYQSAKAFREKRESSLISDFRDASAIDVLTRGVHGRRTRTVFRKALGDTVEVGIIAQSSDSYNSKRWFASSEGVKTVLIETLSVCYEWFGKKNR